MIWPVGDITSNRATKKVSKHTAINKGSRCKREEDYKAAVTACGGNVCEENKGSGRDKGNENWARRLCVPCV